MVLIAGGAGAAFATVALLIDFEQKRQRRFVAGDSCSQRCSLCIAFVRSNLEVTLVYASGRESSQDTPDMKTIKNAISEAAGVKAKAVTGAGNEDKSSLEELLPKTFFCHFCARRFPQTQRCVRKPVHAHGRDTSLSLVRDAIRDARVHVCMCRR